MVHIERPAVDVKNKKNEKSMGPCLSMGIFTLYMFLVLERGV